MSASLEEQVYETVLQMRQVGTDYRTVEAKSASGGLPRKTKNSIAAFANTSGGLLLLGLSDPDFKPLTVDAAKLAADLASTCADDLEPSIRPEIEIITMEGHQVVVALVEELSPAQKPCYVKSKGLEGGAYIRTHDGDRRLSGYEIHVLISGRGQPRDDMTPVVGATYQHLDPELVAAMLRRMRRRGPAISNADDDQILRMVGVTLGDTDPGLSLAGLLALGRYPQQFVPQLNVTFVVYPTVNGEPLDDGTRFLDNESLDGPIPEMVMGALAAVRRNLRRRAVITGEGRLDHWEYPEQAVREVIVNALMHRDYNPLAHGTQVRIELYPDRLEIVSPGGLHGAVDREKLLAEPVTSSRNAQLAKLLEDVEIPRSGITVCENRGSGLLTIAAFLRKAGLEPPIIKDDVNSFKVVIRNDGLLDAAAVEWLSTLNIAHINDRQRLGLVFLRRNSFITNSQYRILTGCDSQTAARELNGLATSGIIEKARGQLWTVWRLAVGLRDRQIRKGFAAGGRGRSTTRSDRSSQIRALLSQGPMSTTQLAEELGLTRGAVLWWLRQMEQSGRVQPTEPRRQSPRNKWELKG